MSKDQALAAKAKGNGFFKEKKWDEAIKCYTEAISLDNTNASFFSNRSACYAGKEDWKNALEDAEKVIKLRPTWGKGYSRKGLALFMLNKMEEALDCYTKGLEHEPSNPSLLEAKQSVMNKLRSNQSMMIMMKLMNDPRTKDLVKDQALMNKVQMLFSNPQMLMSDPAIFEDEKLRTVMSVIIPGFENMSNAGGPGGAWSKPQEKKEPTPPPKEKTPELTKAETLKTEGTKLYKAKKFDEALSKYIEAGNLEPDEPVYLLNQSAVLLMQGKLDECVERCKQTIALTIDKGKETKWIAKAHARLASVAEKKGDIEGAIQELKTSLLECSDGKVRDRLKKLEKAKKKKEELEYINPEVALEHKAKGNALFKEGKWPEAVKEYTEAIKRDPNNHTVYSNRATCYAKLLAFDNSLKDCEKCLKIEPKFVKAWIRKGRIEHLKKQYHKAISSYEKALAIEPTNQELLRFYQETKMAVASRNQGGKIDEKEQMRILNDPEIQAILKDPEIDFILKRAQADPAILQKALNDPEKAKKIQKLFDAGVIRTG